MFSFLSVAFMQCKNIKYIHLPLDMMKYFGIFLAVTGNLVCFDDECEFKLVLQHRFTMSCKAGYIATAP